MKLIKGKEKIKIQWDYDKSDTFMEFGWIWW